MSHVEPLPLSLHPHAFPPPACTRCAPNPPIPRTSTPARPPIYPATEAMTTLVTLETSMGAITLELYTSHAPRTCENFAGLASRGYYNDCPFHRVVPDFMVQGGDPTGTGRGGSSIYGGKFADEIHPSLKHTGAGILSMANSGPDTNGSQLYVSPPPPPPTFFPRDRPRIGD